MFKARCVGLMALIALPLLAGGCKLLGAGQATAEEPPLARAVRVAQAVAMDAEFEGTSFSGVVKAQGQVEIGFQVGGLATQVLVDVGDKVRQGQVLARLDTALYAAQRDQAAGALGQAQAQLSLYQEGTRKQDIAMAESQVRSAEAVKQRVEADFQRVKELYAKGVVAKQKLDEAESAYVQASEGVRAAQEQLDIANEGPRTQEVDVARSAVMQARGSYAGASRQLQYATLTAPCDGTIVWRGIEPGMTVSKDPVFEIANIDALEVQAEVPESKLSAVALGKVAQVELPALPGLLLTARVTNIAPLAQSATRGFPIKLALLEPSAQVVPGLVALVKLDGMQEARGVRIQRRSLVEDQVFVVEDGVARSKPVKTLADAGEYVAVSGIEPGAQVVINGQHLLQDGEAVNVVDALAIEDITKLNGEEQH
jgi:HlyD family secretion protein